MRLRTDFTWIELIVILAIIAVLTAFLYPAIQAARSGGDRRLREKPNEQNRVFCENGMSFIRPSGWTVSPRSEKFVFHSGGGRYPSLIIIFSEKAEDGQIPTTFQSMVNGHTFKPTVFQNEPAFESIVQDRRSNSLEDPSGVSGKLYFFREGNLYLIFYEFRWETEVPENLPLFLESFRPPEIKSTQENATER